MVKRLLFGGSFDHIMAKALLLRSRIPTKKQGFRLMTKAVIRDTIQLNRDHIDARLPDKGRKGEEKDDKRRVVDRLDCKVFLVGPCAGSSLLTKCFKVR